MKDSYLEKLENILEGVENYRFDDANVDEWKELATNVLKGAIAREKANQEADKLANSIWSKLERHNEEVQSNDNQEIAKKIKDIRINRGLTLEEFAELIKNKTRFKTTKSNVSKWEKGLNRPNEIIIKAIYEIGNEPSESTKAKFIKIAKKMEESK